MRAIGLRSSAFSYATFIIFEPKAPRAYNMQVAHGMPKKTWLASKIRDPSSFVFAIEEGYLGGRLRGRPGIERLKALDNGGGQPEPRTYDDLGTQIDSFERLDALSKRLWGALAYLFSAFSSSSGAKIPRSSTETRSAFLALPSGVFSTSR